MNTLQATQKLEHAGFTRAQAEAIVETYYDTPSHLFARLESAGLSRTQAEAVLDHIWAARISLIPRGAKLGGFVFGTILALAFIGLLTVSAFLQHLAK